MWFVCSRCELHLVCPAVSVSPALPPVSNWCFLLLLPAHSWFFSGCFVSDSILLWTQLSSSLSLHMLLKLPNTFEVITSQLQQFIPHFHHAISQNWRTQKSSSPSTLFDSFFLYLFLFTSPPPPPPLAFGVKFFCFVLQWSLEESLQARDVKERPPNPLINFYKVRGTDFSKYR